MNVSDEQSSDRDLPVVLTDAGITLDSHIFRFRGDDYKDDDHPGFSLSEIVNSAIWHSTVANLNDPFEVYFVRDTHDADSLSPGELALVLSNTAMIKEAEGEEYIYRSFLTSDLTELRGDVDAAIEKTMPRLREQFRRYVSLACFTKNCTSRLMWGYYCSGFKGICLIYNREKLRQQDITLSEVTYAAAPQKIKVSTWIVKQKRKESLEGLLDFAKVKHTDWKGEKEYRSLSFLDHDKASAGATGTLVELGANCIDGIIIGDHYHPEAKEKLIAFCMKQGISVFHARADLDNYRVEINA